MVIVGQLPSHRCISIGLLVLHMMVLIKSCITVQMEEDIVTQKFEFSKVSLNFYVDSDGICLGEKY